MSRGTQVKRWSVFSGKDDGSEQNWGSYYSGRLQALESARRGQEQWGGTVTVWDRYSGRTWELRPGVEDPVEVEPRGDGRMRRRWAPQ